MAEKQYWKGLEELHDTSAHRSVVADEFADSKVPLADLSPSLLEATTPRRDFLKYLGFSTAAATLAASCEMPVRKAIPYAIKPENITPGIPEYYATTYVDGGEVVPVVVKTREGRPIKIEGNELSPITRGATSARVQASVLNLYDVARLRGPVVRTGAPPTEDMKKARRKKSDLSGGNLENTGFKQTTYAALDRSVRESLASGKLNVLLTGSMTSPTQREVVQRFLQAVPNSRHITWDPVSYSALLLAHETGFGRRVIPGYRFDRAATIVSLGADFLGTWLSPVEFSKQYGMGRKVSAARPAMSRHYQVESMHTISGAAADRRATCRPSQMGAVAVALYNAITAGTQSALPTPGLNRLVQQAAADLKKGSGLVVCGSQDVAVQTVVAAINGAIGAAGTTMDFSAVSNARQGIDADFAALATALQNNQIGSLFIHGVNPVYEHPAGAALAAAIARVPMSVSFADRLDETAQVCKAVAPDHHWLESWGDAEGRAGYFSIMQPTIAPLFKTRAFADSLMAFANITGTTYADYWREYWMSRVGGGQEAFDRALQDGVINPGGRSGAESGVMTVIRDNETGEADTVLTAPPGAGTGAASSESIGGATFSGTPAVAIAQIGAAVSASAVKGLELITYEKVGIGHGGCWSNNPWLQELPDPITKATWDNYACVSPKTAKGFDAELTSITEVENEKKVLRITTPDNRELTLPIVVVPGMDNNTVAVALGYGRDLLVGRAATATGQNASPFHIFDGSTIRNFRTDVKVEGTSKDYPVSITQTHHSYEGRPIVREMTLAAFAADPMRLYKERHEEVSHYAAKPWEHGDHNTAHDGGAGKVPGGADAGHGTTAHGDEHDGTKGDTHDGAHAGAFALVPGTGPGEGRASTHSASTLEEGFRENGTLYPNYVSPGIHWGMSIDLNSCIGCGACVIGCQSENNISVVGKEHVGLAHEMHWLRIDRYFSGSPEDPDTVQTIFQPMLCQHCDNAPCENVCPVSATNHSSEGLNQMAYNRCIGTKYCANNCPYKVRHFNWMDWNGADSFADNLYEDGRRDDLNEELTRMVLNPDVTVRSRGVMEKCTFCTQRLQEAKLTAKKEGRPVRDGEARTACQQACPTDAILFGDMNDRASNIHKLRTADQKERLYYVLEEIHTLPNVNYLAKVRNTDEIIAAGPKDGITARHI